MDVVSVNLGGVCNPDRLHDLICTRAAVSSFESAKPGM